jgi:YggT family protein
LIDTLFGVLRMAVFGAAALSGVVALTNWAVSRGYLQPFGAWPRFVRSASDPLLRPIERKLLGAGGNPQSAPWWLLAIVLLGGLLLLEVTRWLVGTIFNLASLGQAGPAAILRQLVSWIFQLLMAALFVRVVASWLGGLRYTRWLRPVYALTDWLVIPIQRRLPPFGMLDLSPLVAYLVLMVLRWAAFQVLPY